jgi:hypothetical protein
MNRVRAAVWLSYLMIGVTVLAIAASIWARAQDPTWSQIADSRRNLDVLQGGIGAFAIAVAYGLWRRQEWGRVFGIALGVVVLFYSVGIKVVLPFLAPSSAPITFEWQSLTVGVLSVACIVLLSACRFSPKLTANSMLHRPRA